MTIWPRVVLPIIRVTASTLPGRRSRAYCSGVIIATYAPMRASDWWSLVAANTRQKSHTRGAQIGTLGQHCRGDKPGDEERRRNGGRGRATYRLDYGEEVVVRRRERDAGHDCSRRVRYTLR